MSKIVKPNDGVLEDWDKDDDGESSVNAWVYDYKCEECMKKEEPMSKLDLSLIPTDDLWKELEKRFDSAIFAGQAAKTRENAEATTKWAGEIDGIIFLAQKIIFDVFDYHKENSQEAPE